MCTFVGLRSYVPYPILLIGLHLAAATLIVDDYGHDPCRQAVTDFRDARGVDEPVEPIDWLGALRRRAH